jgi:hypothetical protein
MVVRFVLVLVVAALTMADLAGAEPEQDRPAPEGAAPEGTPSDEERARTLFSAGIAKFRDENWREAEADLRRSYELVPRASTLYNLALVVFKQGRLTESLALASELIRTADPARDARHRQNAATLIERIEQQVSVVEVTVAPADAAITVDGVPAEGVGARRRLIIEPGRHRLEFSRAGYTAETMEMALSSGKERMIDVKLEPVEESAPTAAPSPDRPPAAHGRSPGLSASEQDSGSRSIAPWFIVGAGGALLGAAAVTGVMAKKADDDFVERCPRVEDCSRALEPLQTRAGTLAVATNVLLVSGGVAVLSGFAWWYFTPEPPQGKLRAAAAVTPQGVELRLQSAF